MKIMFVPIKEWPGKKTQRPERARFDTPFQKTLIQMEGEIEKLAGRGAEVLLQAYLRQDQIRIDGWPYSKCVPTEPGVIITFKKRGGQQISMPCDKFTKWEDNFRAIALSLEALRMVDRYGVTQNGEQYRGWEALPPPSQERTTKAEAAEVIARWSGFTVSEVLNGCQGEAIRDAILKTHPDKGGHADLFGMVQKAKAVLEAP